MLKHADGESKLGAEGTHGRGSTARKTQNHAEVGSSVL